MFVSRMGADNGRDSNCSSLAMEAKALPTVPNPNKAGMTMPK